MKTRIACIILYLAGFMPLAGQNLIIINNDTIKTFSDSIALRPTQPYENVRWQYLSKDQWISFGDDSEVLIIRLDSSMVIRGVSFDSLCRQRITDMVHVKVMEPVPVDGSGFTCDRNGGYFLLYDSVYVTVPDSVLESLTHLNLTINESFNGHPFGNTADDPNRKFLFGFQLEGDQPPDGNVRIKIETSAIPGNQILQIFNYDDKTLKWYLFNTSLLFNSEKGYVQVSVGYGKYAVFTRPLISDRKKGKDICKSGTIHASDYSSDMAKDDCQVLNNETRIVFIDCGNTSGGISEQYITPSCKPEIIVELECDVIKIDEITNLRFRVHIANYPLEDQAVTINLSNNSLTFLDDLSAKTYSKPTKKMGEVEFPLIGSREDLPAIIEYVVFWHYYMTTLQAYDENSKEHKTGELKYGYSNGYIPVHVISDCSKTTDIDCAGLKCAAECEKIKDELPVTIDVHPNPVRLRKGHTKTISVMALNRNFESVKMPYFTLSPNDPRMATAERIGREEINIAGFQEGSTAIILEWCDRLYKIDVEVEEDDCSNYMDSVEVVIHPKRLKMVKDAQYRLKLSFLNKNNPSDPPVYIPVVYFSSTNTSVLTVGELGLITAIKTGEASVIVSWCKGSEGESHQIEIPVKVVSDCEATELRFLQPSLSVKKNHFSQLEIIYEQKEDVIWGDYLFIPKITWRSLNEKVATVDSFGVVHGISDAFDWGYTSIEAQWCDSSIKILVRVTLSCWDDPFDISCNGWFVSPYFQYFEHFFSSPGGTFNFSYKVSYQIIFQLTKGQISRRYVKMWGTINGNSFNKVCDLDGPTECLTHIQYEILDELLIPPRYESRKIVLEVFCIYGDTHELIQYRELPMRYTDILF